MLHPRSRRYRFARTIETCQRHEREYGLASVRAESGESGHSGRTRAANRVDLHNQRSGANENEMEFSFVYHDGIVSLAPRS